MSAYNSLSLLIIFTCFSSKLQAEAGLFPISNGKVPAALHGASDSIFNIIPLLRNARIVAAADYDAEIKKRSDGGVYEALIIRDIEACRDAKQDHCPIIYRGTATAFLAGNQSTLWSVRHNFDSQIQERLSELPAGASIIEQQKAILETAPGFLLFDEMGKKLFDTREKGDLAKFSFIGNPKLVDYQLKQGSDVAILSLSRSIDRQALTISDTVPTAHEQIYIMGFPTKTLQRSEKHDSIDSDGASLRVSIGKNLTATAGLFAVMARKDGDPLSAENISLLDSMFLFLDADGVPGQSGAPLLDGKGRIVGIFSSHCIADGAQSPEDAYCEHGGFGPHINWIEKLQAEYKLVLNAGS